MTEMKSGASKSLTLAESLGVRNSDGAGETTREIGDRLEHIGLKLDPRRRIMHRRHCY